ncbi:hypothetical protein ACT7DB_27565 [Bacillus cereus]
MMKAELGSEAEGTAKKLIDEANKQYEKVKGSADKTKKEGIDKLKGSYKDLEDQVNTSTGNILTYWDKIKRWWNNWTPVKKVMEVFSTGGKKRSDLQKHLVHPNLLRPLERWHHLKHSEHFNHLFHQKYQNK